MSENAKTTDYSAPLGAETAGQLRFWRAAANVTLRADAAMSELFGLASSGRSRRSRPTVGPSRRPAAQRLPWEVQV